MANPEHLAILKKGVEFWNQWRIDNPVIKPDLSIVNLPKVDLQRVNFNNADLKGAYLFESNFNDADFSEADLRQVNLSNARLIMTNLMGTDSRGAYLGKANLKYAKLSSANLSGADLSGADLSETDLRGTNFNKANLSGTNLAESKLNKAKFIGANLNRAYFIGANLRRANLQEADLSGTDFSEADLRGSNLRGAMLVKTNFYGANLSGGKFYAAYISEIVLGNTILFGAKDLDESEHGGPSIIDQMTLIKSGKLPDVFLRGCGLSDEFIAQIPFLFWEKQAFEFYSCFISYSSKDEDFAKRLYADLQSEGVRCWFAPEDMKIGDKIRHTLDESIRIYDKLLLILSENSINSKWVEKEVETAFDKETLTHTVLFPIRLDNAVMETDMVWGKDIRRTRHIGNFTNWKDHDTYQAGFKRLLRDLRGEGKMDG